MMVICKKRTSSVKNGLTLWNWKAEGGLFSLWPRADTVPSPPGIFLNVSLDPDLPDKHNTRAIETVRRDASAALFDCANVWTRIRFNPSTPRWVAGQHASVWKYFSKSIQMHHERDKLEMSIMEVHRDHHALPPGCDLPLCKQAFVTVFHKHKHKLFVYHDPSRWAPPSWHDAGIRSRSYQQRPDIINKYNPTQIITIFFWAHSKIQGTFHDWGCNFSNQVPENDLQSQAN